MGIIVAGFGVTSFPESKNPDKKICELKVLYPYEAVDSPKFKRESWGTTTDVPFGKSAIAMNVEYAQKIGRSGAFVKDKEYELRFEFNAETFDNEVVELIPVDPKLADHFKISLQQYKA